MLRNYLNKKLCLQNSKNITFYINCCSLFDFHFRIHLFSRRRLSKSNIHWVMASNDCWITNFL